MKPQTKIHLKYALIYSLFIYLISFVIVIVVYILSSFISENFYQALFFEIIAQLVALIAFVYLSYRALDIVYNKTKIFNNLVVWLILLFFLVIDRLISLIGKYIQAGYLSFDLFLDAILGQPVSLALILTPVFVSTYYQKKHKVRYLIKAEKPIKFFKTDFPIFVMSIILIITFMLLYMAKFPYFPSFESKSEGYVGLSGLILAVSVIFIILMSYLISCFAFYIYQRIRHK